MTVTFVFDHEVFVEWQVHSVHAKLPSLCALWSAEARVVPDQVCSDQRAAWLVHKHHLHAMVECPCMLDKTQRHLQTSLHLSKTNEINFCSREQPQNYMATFCCAFSWHAPRWFVVAAYDSPALYKQLALSATALGALPMMPQAAAEDKHTKLEAGVEGHSSLEH